MDSEYLKRHVGKALSEGLAEICLKKPTDPIEYLALWLRKYVENGVYDFKVEHLYDNLHLGKIQF